MLYIGDEISGQVGGVATWWSPRGGRPASSTFWPALDAKEIIGFAAAWVTMMFGSIPQQDVFQRVQSSKTEKIAVWGSVFGGGCISVRLRADVPGLFGDADRSRRWCSGLIDTDPQHDPAALITRPSCRCSPR